MTFDLEKARDAAKFDDRMAITMFPLAIAEIERLQASLVEHEEHENQTHAILGAILGTDDTLENVAKRAMARIAELEDALAEYQRLGKVMNGRLPCLTLHGDCGRCSAQTREVCGALEQIAGGKIEPGVKPRSWQITEDRVTAIDQGLRFLEWSNAKTGNVETKKRIAILKTMLEEAGDEHGFER